MLSSSRAVRWGGRALRAVFRVAGANRSPALDSSYFDADWYLAAYPDVASSSDSLRHYLDFGWKEGRNPGPLFDTKWYIATYPDVASSGENPLIHFLQWGATEGRLPHPLFVGVAQAPSAAPRNKGLLSLERYTAMVRGKGAIFEAAAHARQARMFDDEHYRTQYLIPSENDAALHFLAIGEGEGATPFYGYNPQQVAANLRAAGIAVRDSVYSAAVEEQITALQNRIKHDVQASRHTWVTPCSLELDALDGAFRRTFEIKAARRRAATTWSIDSEIVSRVVVPIIAPDMCLRSVLLPVEGRSVIEAPILFILAETPTGPPRIDGHARYDAKTSCLVWSVQGGVLQRGRRYFLRIQTDRATGLEFCAKSFDPAALMTARLVRIGFDLDVAIPSSWQMRFGEKPLVTVLLGPESLTSGSPELVERIRGQFPHSQVEVLDARRTDTDALDLVRRSRTVLFDASALRVRTLDMSAADLVRVLRIHGTDLALLDEGTPHAAGDRQARQVVPGLSELSQDLPWLYVGPPEPLSDAECAARPSLDRRGSDSGSAADSHPGEPNRRSDPAADGNGTAWPHVAVVTVLYRKANNIGPFLRAVYRQSYPGSITVVFVDDCSPDTSFDEMSEQINATFDRKPAHISVQTLRNAENLGNCQSRNAGIAVCAADIYVLIDADCLMNGDFIRAHVAEHLLGGADAVIGPYNIESESEPGDAMLQRLESCDGAVLALANMQDALLLTAPVNTITRNLSLRREWFDAHGAFDEALTYSTRPDSGFGWEDVDIGARIYSSNGRIRFTPRAFSIHLTHAPSLAQSAQARGSAKNFRYLLRKHDFIRTVSRRWMIDTADRIVTWAQAVETSSSDIDALNLMLADSRPTIAPLLPYLRKQKRRLRILTHRWHVGHQYEIYKLPFDFTLVTGTGTGMTNEWNYNERPLASNVRLVCARDVNPCDFDMAIVHFDENVLSPDLGNGVLSADWGDTFRWFLDYVKLPMIAVCHGTVQFVGQYGANSSAIDSFELYSADAELLRSALADVPVVVNSHEAAREWGFHKMHVIWHGYDPQEFHPGQHDLDVVSHGIDPWRPHYRGAHQLRDVLSRLGSDITVSTHKHASPTPVPLGDRRYAEYKFSNWIDHLGRHKIYLNTTLRSPMPRARTEAMLCGVIPVSLDSHDVSRFIQNGVNGFYSSSVEELAEFCRTICNNATMREKMSGVARNTAMDVFNHDRFLTRWVELVEEAVR